MTTLITGGTLVTPHDTLTDRTLVIEGRKIKAIVPPDQAGRIACDEVIDARGKWVAPGLIDVHVHGGAGHDAMDSTPEAIHGMARFFAQHGVTSFLPTTAAAPPQAIQRAIECIAGCSTLVDGAHPPGVHVEGPYLNPSHRGAQPPQHLRDPDPTEYEAWLAMGSVRLITLAPERPGAKALIARGRQAQVEFAVGHSGASYEQTIEAADLGLRQATHTFNGMLGLHHRDPGTVGAVLVDGRIYAQVIPDGVHLHPAVVRLIVQAKGLGRTILITDAIRAAGLADGEYSVAGDTIRVRNGVCRTASGSLAGSTLTMDVAVHNAMRFAGLSLGEALRMATATPAEAMGWSGSKGVLAPGADADLILLDSDLQVHLTMVAGRTVFTRS